MLENTIIDKYYTKQIWSKKNTLSEFLLFIL